MTFVYPAVFTPKKDGKGYDAYFPDLECCEAEGPDLEDAVENAREAAYNWSWRKRAICRHRRISMI
jgi:predicted RNase H-like HicB family nuclease